MEARFDKLLNTEKAAYTGRIHEKMEVKKSR
jgi:hypothetical protein